VHRDDRTRPPTTADERATLTGVLRFQRETLAYKCAGLSDQQLRQRPITASTLSLLGLVRHLTEVERSWFRGVLNGEPVDYLWESDSAAAFEVAAAGASAALDSWRAECARSDAIIDAAESLDLIGRYGDITGQDGDITGRDGAQEFSLRYILSHLIEEYARHNGHADLLREQLDGSTGE
jgi:uncharacterized damage-inducible protein DinB